MNDDNERILLVVEPDDMVRETLRRLIKRHQNHFKSIIVVSEPKTAIEVLEKMRVTHLICAQDLGPKCSIGGANYVRSWRITHPHIEKALIFTSQAFSTGDKYPEIDDIVSKAISVKDLLGILLK